MTKKHHTKTKSYLPAHARLVKKHFPTFYERPAVAVVILFGLIAAFWLLR